MNQTPIRDPEDLISPEEIVRLRAEQVRLLHKNAAVSMTGSLVNSLILVVILWHVTDHVLLIGWTAGIFIVTAFRYLGVLRFRRASDDPLSAVNAEKHFVAGTALSGIAWGLSGLLIFPETSVAHQAFLAFVLGGMVIGSAGAYAVLMRAFFAFSIPAAAPFLVSLVIIGDAMHLAMGGMVLLFMVLMTAVALHINTMTTTSVKVRFANMHLLSYLASAKEDAENLARDLERENAERRKAEEAQRVSAEAFRDLYNNAPCGYHSLSFDGVLVRMNDTELKWIGYERDEVIGKLRFSDLLTPESKETFKASFPLFKERGKVLDLEYKMLRKDGTVLPVLLSAVAIRDDKGEYLMSRATVFDISERKQVEAEVVRAAKLATLGELAASVAHEINNPLNSIINYAQILKDLGDGQHDDYDLAGEILHEGTRIAAIVRNMLSYARESSPGKSAIAVENIINNSIALCTTALRREGIELRVVIGKGLPLVMGNLQQLQQVILNLISNARHALKERHHRPDPGKVLEVRGEEVAEGGRPLMRISVMDNGSGIPAAVLKRVTEPFFTTKPPEVGTGLGLSISRKIIEDHQGRLTVESVEGQYTKVSIELPAATESVMDEGR